MVLLCRFADSGISLLLLIPRIRIVEMGINRNLRLIPFTSSFTHESYRFDIYCGYIKMIEVKEFMHGGTAENRTIKGNLTIL